MLSLTIFLLRLILLSGHILHDGLPIWLGLKYKFERLHVSDTPCRPSAALLRDQDDPHDDAHPEGVNNSYATDDDELPTEKVSQELVEEMSQTVDEAKLHKVVNEIDPKAPALSLVNQDLLYLNKGNSRPKKIVMSLHKFPVVIFPDDDIEERAEKQKEPEKPKEVVYSNSKIVQIIKTYWEVRHEHKFITEIIARRGNCSIMLITKLDYKNHNKNDIEDMYVLIVNGKVEYYAETGLLWSLVLEGLKSYNNNVKHGYVTPSLSKEDVEYLKLFKEEIEERLKHRDQMRHWEIYVNERPLGSRRERLE
ncbi:hypothetical protein Tco_1418177 [Tanacetum coccineum]